MTDRNRTAISVYSFIQVTHHFTTVYWVLRPHLESNGIQWKTKAIIFYHIYNLTFYDTLVDVQNQSYTNIMEWKISKSSLTSRRIIPNKLNIFQNVSKNKQTKKPPSASQLPNPVPRDPCRFSFQP